MSAFYTATCTIWKFAVVPADMAIHQVSTKHSILHVFILYGYTYVAPQDESCRYCYDLCRELRLFSLGRFGACCVLFCTSTVSPDKYEVNITGL